jgi:hypothetical protein
MNLGVGDDYFAIPAAGQGQLSFIQQEMNRIDALRRTDPDRCRKMFEIGADLVLSCKHGQISKIRKQIQQLPKEDMLIYFSVKMFKESLANGHLIIADQLIKSGFPFKQAALPNALLEMLSYNTTSDDSAEKAILFLNDRGFDLNSHDRVSWETGVHVSVRRKFTRSVEALIRLGADVNAVARDDIQPLHLADEIDNDSSRMAMIELLMKQ